ncbi:MAG: hypothetical protein CL844_03700 [Crocinitomicaceae bacterium]|nr:hypothetical protein [Crocinitomicaceae bacterium]
MGTHLKRSLVKLYRRGVLDGGREVHHVHLAHHRLGEALPVVVDEHKLVGVRVRGPDLGGEFELPVRLGVGLEGGLVRERVHLFLVQKVPLVDGRRELDARAQSVVVEDGGSLVQVLEVGARRVAKVLDVDLVRLAV